MKKLRKSDPGWLPSLRLLQEQPPFPVKEYAPFFGNFLLIRGHTDGVVHTSLQISQPFPHRAPEFPVPQRKLRLREPPSCCPSFLHIPDISDFPCPDGISDLHIHTGWKIHD